MFANLQNKINLKKLNENRVDVDPSLVYQEPFNVINSTIDYFMQDKDVINNVVFKEEVIEYENQENVAHLTNMVVNEQKFIYNNDITLNHLREEELIVGGLADGMSIDDIAEKHGVGISQITSQVEKGIDIEMEHVNDADRAREIALDHLFEFPDYYDRLEKMEDEAKAIHENYNRYRKVKGILPTLLEEVNDEQKLELDRYRMVHNDLEDSEEYDVKDLFDADIIDIARNEHLEHIQTMNWLENKLRDYSKEMNSDLKDKFLITIENNLKKLDVNNTEELKNKIKDVNGTIKILKERQGLVEGDRNE